MFNLLVLNQRERFKELVEGTDAAWHNNKRVGIFHQQRFSDEKIMQPYTTIEIHIGYLLEWQLDVASNRAATDVFCAAVRRFHNARAAASHDGEAKARNRRAHFPRQFVMRIVRCDSCRAEDGYARTNEMESTISAQKIAHDSQQRANPGEARFWAVQKYFISAARRRNNRRCRRRILRGLHRSFTCH